MPAADLGDNAHFATFKIVARVGRMLANTPYYTPLSAVQEYWVDRASLSSRKGWLHACAVEQGTACAESCSTAATGWTKDIPACAPPESGCAAIRRCGRSRFTSDRFGSTHAWKPKVRAARICVSGSPKWMTVGEILRIRGTDREREIGSDVDIAMRLHARSSDPRLRHSTISCKSTV
jgi:hypothetical protein